LWSVTVLKPPYKSFTYQEPVYFSSRTWRPGMRVLVPMGRTNRLCVGVLQPRVSLESFKNIKSIYWPLERKNLISPEYLEMINELSVRQMIQAGRVLACVLPGSFRRVPEAMISVQDRKKVLLPEYGSEISLLEKTALAWSRGELDFALKEAGTTEMVFVNKEPPWSILPNARLQWKVMDMLWEQGAISSRRLRQMFGPGVSGSVRSLADKGLVRISREEDAEYSEQIQDETDDYELTHDQENALSCLLPRLEKKEFDVSVLHGITGSGKSMVYMRLARTCLRMGKTAIILAPEIAIACQLYALARKTLSGLKVVLHHGLKTQKSRESLFLELSSGRAPVVLVGTRSALFMPAGNIGLIIVDEEHDESFKQDQNFVYQAKEIAHYLARRDRAMLVLGSATPDIKTYNSAIENRVNLVNMENRVGKSLLPSVSFVDLKKDKPLFGPLSGVCEKALRETLGRGEQVVIMHNRRGYSPIIMCSDCSEPARCEHCQVSLTLHKKRQRLVCHYCGQSLPFSIICSHCKSSEFVPLGDGTEKVEEFFQEHLEGVRVLRLDRDSTRNPAVTEKMLAEFAENKAQVLVGTQMLSKGHSFPNVTLAIVLDGDLGLGFPDYRSSERTFQLLVQLSGRAGRGDKPGRVFIQTRNPDHYCWNFVAQSDYQGFYNQEIKKRRLFGYPPFVRLGLIRMSFPSSWSRKDGFIHALKQHVKDTRSVIGVKIMGPAPAPLARLRNRDRYQLLIKAPQWTAIRDVYSGLLPLAEKSRVVRISLDLDPLNML
jgi:primosomal protein N' (replication factor Y) (superfamily II helicase)